MCELWERCYYKCSFCKIFLKCFLKTDCPYIKAIGTNVAGVKVVIPRYFRYNPNTLLSKNL